MEPIGGETHALTNLLGASARGDVAAREQVWQLVYAELRRLAQSQMIREAPGRTLQPTALVHEAYLRLLGARNGFENRRHFFAAAARAMQEIRVDDARRRSRLKRGGPGVTVMGGGRPPSGPTSGRNAGRYERDETAAFDQDADEVVALNDAMAGLAEAHPEAAEVVRLRYFAGMGMEEIADVLELSVRTVHNRWRLARAWLFDKLDESDGA